MKKYLSILFIITIFFPIYSLGYNVNFELDAGFAGNLFSNQVEKNITAFENFDKISDFLNAGGTISGDVVVTQNISAEVGIQFQNVVLNYSTSKEFGNGNIKLNYPVLKVPVLFKYTLPLSKTIDKENYLNLAMGINLSYVIGNQSYKDDITTYVGNFVSPKIDCGVTLKATFVQKFGPGKAYIGLRADMNVIPQGYKIGEKDFSYGNIFTVAPVIGYTFSIKEDKGLSKITEKNKRIKDIDVK